MITIGKPYLTDTQNKTRLNAEININNTKHTMYYELDSKYSEYIVTERNDSFFIALLPYALSKGYSIHSEAPLSEKLVYQVQSHLIPALHKYADAHSIDIKAATTSEKLNTGEAVGTGFSGGVDSFYTLASHLEQETQGYNITHLTFLNVGSHGDFGGEKARDLFYERAELAEEFSHKYSFELIVIDSNISEIIRMPFIKSHTFRSLSATLILQKLFHVYYYSSGHNLTNFKLSSEDTAYYDLLNAHVLATEDTLFYSTGATTTRLEKVKYISDYSPSHEFLNVCQMSKENCGMCEKCRRTMLELYANKDLDLYSSVFDNIKFEANLSNRLGYMLFQRENKEYKDIINKLKKNGDTIPLTAYIQCAFFHFKNLFRNQEKIKQVYFKAKKKYHFE